MTAIRTARERARAELAQEILREARRQLADAGAQSLSLRAVARELGMASSAIYRYFPSRDELLTALIIEAYDAIGDRVERADAAAPQDSPRARWYAVAHTVRDWAREHPHEYALVYGSPVPGYRAPQETVAPAARVPLALLAIVRSAWTAPGRTPDSAVAAGGMGAELLEQAERMAAELAPEVPAEMVVRAVMVWTQLFGMVSFELYGHLVGSMDPAGPFFDYALERCADFLQQPPV